MKRIVLIDDDSTTNYLNKMIIERSGLVDEILTFESASEALDYFTNQNSDVASLVLLDINMPIMNGWQFLDHYQTIKSRKPNKIVLLSSSINPADKQKAERKDSVMDFRSKPLSVEMVNELVDSYLKAV